MTMFEKFRNWFFGVKKTEEVIPAPYKVEPPVESAPVSVSPELPPETPVDTVEIKKPRGKPRSQVKKQVDNKKSAQPTKAAAKMTTRKSKKTQL